MTQTSYPAKKNPDPDSVIGIWISQAKDSKMEIYKYSNTYRGKLLAGWGNDLFEKDGKTLKKDTKNKDVNLRNRTLLNMEFITDITYKNGEYLGGKLYMAKISRIISCKMKMVDGNLVIKPFIWIPLLGVNKTFTKVD